MSISAKRLAMAVAACLLGMGGWWVWSTVGSTGRGTMVGGERGVGPEPLPPMGAELGQLPPSEYPAIATERLIAVSLGLLAKNGADLTKPMPSRHRVVAAGPAVVAEVTAWARTAGFEPTEPVSFHEHGGVEHFQLDLVRVGVPEARMIEAQGREVFAGIGRIPGAHYQSWMGDIIR